MTPRAGRHGGGQRSPATAFLRMRQQLDLTDDQVKRLEALQAAPMPQRNESDLLRARADLMDATRGDGNLGAARAALEKMSRVRTEQMLAGLKSRQDARNVLTAAQKTKIDNLRGQMRGQMRGKMRGKARDRMRQDAPPTMPPFAPRRRGDDLR